VRYSTSPRNPYCSIALDYFGMMVPSVRRRIPGVQSHDYLMTPQPLSDGTQLMPATAEINVPRSRNDFFSIDLHAWRYSWRGKARKAVFVSFGAMPLALLGITRHLLCYRACKKLQILPARLVPGAKEKCSLLHSASRCWLPIAQPCSMALSRTLHPTLNQPKPRPRPLAALVPLPILLPLAAGMVPLPLPTDVPAAV